jgi:creatinine amidohydrolase
VIRLFDVPHTESRRLLATGAPVFLLVNPVEYHGPHLSLHNDRLLSTGLVRDLHAGLALRHDWPLLMADDLEVGVEPAPGPGSRPVPYAVVRELIRESCRTLAELGAKRVVLMTFHGNPLHGVAVQAGVELLQSLGVQALSPFNLVLQELRELDPSKYVEAVAHIPDEKERAEVLAGLQLDFHAGFFETSMALHYAPQSVDPEYKRLPPCPPLVMRGPFEAARRTALALGKKALAGELSFAAAGAAWYDLRPFPGYTGRPHLASAEAGSVFARSIVQNYLDTCEAVFEGAAPPEPIMVWAAQATLGGRIGQLHVPIEAVSVAM